ncbi:MAG: hypothetical protein ABL904_22400 [Hyphomicrobiaceae bacterium]
MRHDFIADRRVQLAALAVVFLTATAASADILIVSSSAPELKPGMQLADSDKLDVPAGAKVRVMLPSGATLQINGAASRPVKDISKGEPLVETVWAKAKELLATGGVDQSRVGATRSFKPSPAPTAVSSFSWTMIAASATGNVCVERGARLSIERPAAGRAADVTVIDTAKNMKAIVGFAGDAMTADWPGAMPPSADTIYQITAAGTGQRQIKLRLIDKAGTADGAAMRTLLENDCRTQAKAWAKG